MTAASLESRQCTLRADRRTVERMHVQESDDEGPPGKLRVIGVAGRHRHCERYDDDASVPEHGHLGVLHHHLIMRVGLLGEGEVSARRSRQIRSESRLTLPVRYSRKAFLIEGRYQTSTWVSVAPIARF